MSMARRFGGAGIRRGARAPVRLPGGLPSEVQAIMGLSPSFLYVPLEDYVTVDGSGNISNLTDLMNPGVSARELVQGTPGSRPAWLAASGLPSGVPAVQGDNIDDILIGNEGTGVAAAADTGTTYALLRAGPNTGGQEAAAGYGHPSQGSWMVLGGINTSLGIRRSGAGNVTTGTAFAAGASGWVEVERTGGVGAIVDSAGGTAGGAWAVVNAQLLTMCGTLNGSLGEHSNHEVALFVGWVTAIDAGDKAIVRAVLDSYGGL